MQLSQLICKTLTEALWPLCKCLDHLNHGRSINSTTQCIHSTQQLCLLSISDLITKPGEKNSHENVLFKSIIAISCCALISDNVHLYLYWIRVGWVDCVHFWITVGWSTGFGFNIIMLLWQSIPCREPCVMWESLHLLPMVWGQKCQMMGWMEVCHKTKLPQTAEAWHKFCCSVLSLSQVAILIQIPADCNLYHSSSGQGTSLTEFIHNAHNMSLVFCSVLF